MLKVTERAVALLWIVEIRGVRYLMSVPRKRDNTFGMPCGKVDPQDVEGVKEGMEILFKALARELLEETGLVLDISSLLPMAITLDTGKGSLTTYFGMKSGIPLPTTGGAYCLMPVDTYLAQAGWCDQDYQAMCALGLV